MSMPNIPNITPIIDIDREDAFNMLLASIALEEMGLAHIINAEGEKIQYVLDSKIHKSASIAEIKEVNLGVERIIRETMKLQMLLQEKLENVMSRIPKTPNHPDPPCPPDVPCPRPPRPKCRPTCILTGRGEGQVSNKSDFFHCGAAVVESGILPVCEDSAAFSLKYTLCREKERHVVSALFLAIPESIEVDCPNRPKPCPVSQDPNMLIMRGQGVMALKKAEQKLVQCSVAFTLTVWDYGCSKKFQMTTCSPNPEFNHDSGVVSVTSGNLEVRKYNKQKTDTIDIKFDF